MPVSSCKHSDFEIAYKTNFEKVYGKIKPDQTWDLTTYNLNKLGLVGGPSYAAMTRATRADASTEGVVFNPNHDQMPGFGTNATTGNNKDNDETGGNQYYNDNKLSKWIKDNKNNPVKAPDQVVFEHPTADFTILPVADKNVGNWELHMVDMKNNNDYKITDQSMVNRALVILNDKIQGDIYFYLKLSDGTKTDKMAIFTPDNGTTHAADGNPCIVLGCETGVGSEDYRDLKIIIVVPQVKQPEDETETIETLYPVDKVSKKYMIEDRGSTADFDFNDIVVLVERVHKSKITTIKGESSIEDLGTTTYAKLVYLCGTIPFTLTIGGQSFGQMDGQVEYTPTPGDGYGDLSSTDGAVINNNNTVYDNIIQVTVGNGTNNGTTYTFPTTGEMPLMIAVDPSVDCMGEGQNVSETWFQTYVKQQQTVVEGN